MNIDLRTISPDFEEQVIRVKSKFGYNTNSKAVEHCTINYLDKLKEIEELKKQLSEAKDQISSYKRHLSNLRDCFSWVMKKE